MIAEPNRIMWVPSHRVVLKVMPAGTVHCLCVMLAEDGDAWTRHDWLHGMYPSMRRTREDHWAVNRHNLPMTGQVRVIRVEPLEAECPAAA